MECTAHTFFAQKLFVDCLPDGCDKASLQALFAKYGEVVECNIVEKNDAFVKKKYAFVYMSDYSQASAAMKALDEYEFMGRKIRVRMSNSILRRQPGMGADECYRCGKKGHWHKDCKDPNMEEAYLLDPSSPTGYTKIWLPKYLPP